MFVVVVVVVAEELPELADWVVVQDAAQKVHSPGLMFCCQHLDILNLMFDLVLLVKPKGAMGPVWGDLGLGSCLVLQPLLPLDGPSVAGVLSPCTLSPAWLPFPGPHLMSTVAIHLG